MFATRLLNTGDPTTVMRASILVVNTKLTNLDATLTLPGSLGVAMLDGTDLRIYSDRCTRNNVTTDLSGRSSITSRVTSALVTNTNLYRTSGADDVLDTKRRTIR